MIFNKHSFITFGILGGLVLGFVIGQLVFSFAAAETREFTADVFKFLGTTFFMNLLKMVLIPLVISSVVVGVASIGDPASLGRIGGYTLLYYFSTMLLAVLLGILMVSTIRPGKGMEKNIIAEGRQAYVVFPRIESEDPAAGIKAVNAEAKRLADACEHLSPCVPQGRELFPVRYHLGRLEAYRLFHAAANAYSPCSRCHVAAGGVR